MNPYATTLGRVVILQQRVPLPIRCFHYHQRHIPPYYCHRTIRRDTMMMKIMTTTTVRRPYDDPGNQTRWNVGCDRIRSITVRRPVTTIRVPHRYGPIVPQRYVRSPPYHPIIIIIIDVPPPPPPRPHWPLWRNNWMTFKTGIPTTTTTMHLWCHHHYHRPASTRPDALPEFQHSDPHRHSSVRTATTWTTMTTTRLGCCGNSHRGGTIIVVDMMAPPPPLRC